MKLTMRHPLSADEAQVLWLMASRGFASVRAVDRGSSVMNSWTLARSECESDTVTITRFLADPHLPWGFVRPATGQARYALTTDAVLELVGDLQPEGN